MAKGKTPRPGATAVQGNNPGQFGGVTSQPVPKPQGNWAKGYQPQNLQFPKFTPEVQSALMQILQSGLGQLNQPQFNPGQYQFDFNPIAQQAIEGFQNKTIPSILERLTASGGRDSSAYMHTLGQAGKELETNLASLGAQYGLQNRGQEAQIGLQSQGQQIQKLLALLGLGTQSTFENAYTPRQPGFFENAGVALAGAAPKAAALYATGGLPIP